MKNFKLLFSFLMLSLLLQACSAGEQAAQEVITQVQTD